MGVEQIVANNIQLMCVRLIQKMRVQGADLQIKHVNEKGAKYVHRGIQKKSSS